MPPIIVIIVRWKSHKIYNSYQFQESVHFEHDGVTIDEYLQSILAWAFSGL